MEGLVAPPPAPSTNNSATSLIKWLSTWAGILARVESLVLLAAALLTVQAVFGSYRRRSKSTPLKLVLWAAFSLTEILVAYAFGLMQPASFPNELYLVWVTFLMTVVASPYSMSTYSIHDYQQWKRQVARHMVLYSLYMGWTFTLYETTNFWAPSLGLIIATAIKLAERFLALGIASFKLKVVVVHNRVVADYMRSEHKLTDGGEVDPGDMRGYKYLVAGEERMDIRPESSNGEWRTEKIVTIDKLWRCDGHLLLSSGGDLDGRLKDTCLSFALFKLLRRRFAGYNTPESVIPKTRDFVTRGLLSGGHERAFRVVEVELAFLYDFFYTKYPFAFMYQIKLSKYNIGLIEWLMRSAMVLIVSLWIVVLLWSYKPRQGDYHLGGDVALTLLVVFVFMSMEIWQVVDYMFSDWFKVHLLCKYVKSRFLQRSKLVENVLGFVCRRRIWKPWSNKIGQYSLLQSFDHDPSSLTSALLQVRKGMKASDPIKLPDEVKETIARSIVSNNATLCNGVRSLHQNRVCRELSWACRLPTCTHVILVWHVATSMCEIESRNQHNLYTRETQYNHVVANSLSRYLAYLVIFQPELLPDHRYDASRIFDDAVSETRDFLNDCEGMNERLKRMMTVGEAAAETMIIGKGAKLAKQMMDGMMRDEGRRWKMLADFWTELILYLAPSGHTTPHAECLVEGGEFITHLWALLTHAGVLDQPRTCDHCLHTSAL